MTAPAADVSHDARVRRAGELLGARRLPEAEVEILRALTSTPGDLRALKLLALVRFKLGRLAAARDVYRDIARATPDDPVVRLNLGLIAIKLEALPEAVTELEAAARLGPADERVWSALGHAYARVGREGDAAAAFRHAGQGELSVETLSVSQDAPIEPSAGAARPQSLSEFTIEHLVPDGVAAGGDWPSDGVLSFAVEVGAHVRAGALLTADDSARLVPATRWRQGQLTGEPLGFAGVDFFRSEGAGVVWLSLGPSSRRRLLVLTLEDDIFYLREDCVVAFDDQVTWECGRVPVSGMPLLHFRASGRVVVAWEDDDVIGVPVAEGKGLVVDEGRLFGWVGRVAVRGVRYPGVSRSPHLSCEGEGVLLLSRHQAT